MWVFFYYKNDQPIGFFMIYLDYNEYIITYFNVMSIVLD